ncbi:MAG: hypothetical protein JNK73_02850 [Bacteroidia bacterium]|nr:hypothetical protein [Bacteroidia bacterium]
MTHMLFFPENPEIRPLLCMNLNKALLKQAGIFALFVIGFWIISALYLAPALGDKTLAQGDMQQVGLMRHAAEEYKKVNGSYPDWNDRVFSGMPGNLITGLPTGNFLLLTRIVEIFGAVKSPFNFLFVAMLSMFTLLVSARVNRWLSAAGAIGYAFMTFSISSYEAGHITKVLAMGVMPGVLAGLVLISRRQYLWGAACLGLFFGMLISYFHYQVAYYMGIILGVYMLFELIQAIRSKNMKHAFVATAIVLVMSGLSALASIGKAVDTLEYSKATMRGGSAVASEVPKGGPKQTVNAKGLDMDYAFRWSYGIGESMTLLIPSFKGGSTGEPVGENELGQDRLPLYFGDMPSTSGPIYMGAILIFLFLLGMVVVFMAQGEQGIDDAEKKRASMFLWFSILTVLISLILSWGRHFGLNSFFFNYLPFYNKFRTPMMALAIAQVIVPFLGLYGLQLLLGGGFSEGGKAKTLKYSLLAIGGILGLAALMTVFSDFAGAADAEIRKGSQGPQVLGIIKELRSKAVWADWFRSLAFTGLAFGLVWYTVRKNGSQVLLWVGLILLIGIDLIGVSKRYLTEDNWQDKVEEEAVAPTPKDAEVMKYNKDRSRVIDMRIDPFNDNHAAPFHRNIGGYHPAKLSRYQDIISYCITPSGEQISGNWIMNNNALDMLNCRFILSTSQEGKKEEVYERPTALGHAWFVQKAVVEPTAKAAIQKLNKINIREEVVIEATDKAPKPAATSWTKDSGSSIRQTYYSFDTLKYEATNKAAALAVFSEVYYNEKNGSWKAFLNGKELPVLRVNYILRGLELPAAANGKNEISFIYTPGPRGNYINMERAASGTILLLFFGVLGMSIFNKSGQKEENA